MPSEPRTAIAVRTLADAVDADMAEIIDDLDRAAARLSALETAARGLDGLAGVCRQKATELGLMREVLSEESSALRGRLLPGSKPVAVVVSGPEPARVRAVREGRDRA